MPALSKNNRVIAIDLPGFGPEQITEILIPFMKNKLSL